MTGPNFISQYRTAVVSLLDALEGLQSLRTQYDALDLGTRLKEEDFEQGHSDIVKGDLIAAVTSAVAFATLLAAGHATNLYRLKM